MSVTADQGEMVSKITRHLSIITLNNQDFFYFFILFFFLQNTQKANTVPGMCVKAEIRENTVLQLLHLIIQDFLRHKIQRKQTRSLVYVTAEMREDTDFAPRSTLQQLQVTTT
jgi:hypothetical protein